MNLNHLHPALVLGFFPVLGAQEPPTPQPEAQRPKLTAASTVDFLSLRDLLNGQVHNLMALEAGKDAKAVEASDTRLAQPVATIHDAVFDADGKLQSLVVAIGKRGDGAAPVLLPLKEVRWHPSRKLLVTDLTAAQIAGLKPQTGDKTEKPPAEATARATWLATEMVAASARSRGEGDAVPDDKGTVQTIWYVPAANRIGLVAVGKSPRLVPWSAVKPLPGGPPLVLEVSAPADRLNSAPAVTDIAVPPDAAVRLQAYRHFALELPPWDRPGDVPVDKPGK